MELCSREATFCFAVIPSAKRSPFHTHTSWLIPFSRLLIDSLLPTLTVSSSRQRAGHRNTAGERPKHHEQGLSGCITTTSAFYPLSATACTKTHTLWPFSSVASNWWRSFTNHTPGQEHSRARLASRARERKRKPNPSLKLCRKLF